MRNDFLTFGKPRITNEDIKNVVKILKSGWIGTGPIVKKFEDEFSKFKNVDSSKVLALNSCTSAITLALKTLNFEKNSEIITTPMTFCSTINTIINANLKPVFVDINENTRNINPDLIEKKISKKTKAILIVHFAGMPCEMDKILKITKKYKLKLIEDCAHSIESEYKGKKIGTFGDFSCFSFYANKNITTGGEGGILICKSKKNAEFCKKLALHGMSKDAWKRFNKKGFSHYDVIYSGFKYNLTDLAASTGLGGLKLIKENLKKRIEICKYYEKNLKNLPIILPDFCYGKDIVHAHHLYNIIITNHSSFNRDEVIKKLNDLNIGAGIHYQCVTKFTFYRKKFSFKKNSFPIAEKIGENNISLPLSPGMKKYDAKTVVDAIKRIFYE